jgi:hypothetical protein
MMDFSQNSVQESLFLSIFKKLKKRFPYILFLIAGILLFQFLSAQEPVKTSTEKTDSLKFNTPGMVEPVLDLPALKLDFSDFSDFALKFNAPSFDFSGVLKSRWKTDVPFNSQFLTFPYISTYFPFSGTVFNQAISQATDRLKIGGNSFGINSLLHAPLPAIGPGNYDYRGMSVFMEYKINKNFRIGGSISVSGNPYQP